MSTKQQLVDYLVEIGTLQTPAIIRAFTRIDRADFVPARLATRTYINEPLPIGFGQTISQPQTVAFMLEQLQPQAGQIILDVGSGSGWQAALLGHIVSHDETGQELPPTAAGRVIGLELIPELAKLARRQIGQYSLIKKQVIEIHCLNAGRGFPTAAPFDRIISAAAADTVPPAWLDQLKAGGRLVLPINSSIVAGVKTDRAELEITTWPGFAFVPFIDEAEE